MPLSESGSEALRVLDVQIDQAREPRVAVPLLLGRATFKGRLEDYEAALAKSAAWIAAAPRDPLALATHVQVLTRVHEFAAARKTIEDLKQVAKDPSEWDELARTIDEATGQLAGIEEVRVAAAQHYPTATNVTRLATLLAVAGRTDEAIALVPKAAAGIRDNSPGYFAQLLFQWGRLYEYAGKPAVAADFFAAALERVPGYVEAAAHRAQALIASGDRETAKRVLEATLVNIENPELLGTLAQLEPAKLADAKVAWERYVKALPLAFSDHAARFYLAVANSPAFASEHEAAAKRALELARVNLANRDTWEARVLVVEAALAAGDVAGACEAAGPIARMSPSGGAGSGASAGGSGAVGGSSAGGSHSAAGGSSAGSGAPTGVPRAARFTAWQALKRCGRTQDAAALARELGIPD